MLSQAALAVVDQITKNNDHKKGQFMDMDVLPMMVNMMNSPDPATSRRAVTTVCSYAVDGASWKTIRECNGFPKLVEMLMGPSSPKQKRVPLCAARTLNPTAQAWGHAIAAQRAPQSSL